ncbi:MAG TPA: BTAD domain-containing putative transcriptional regulator [Gaiellaceae bacterium]|nr:BTAD domain-containing putative transcriptional regulator [Gaiellaceae bacterium]
MPRDELAEVLWGGDLPATWDKALRVLMTKMRALLTECGIDGSTALTSAFGCYELTLPAGTWIDLAAAAGAVARAEEAVAARDLAEARTHGELAADLARRSFLPGEAGDWVEEKRRELRDLLVRALECLCDASLGEDNPAEAVRHATEATELEPFRESGYRRLMQAHVATGNPAEALRVYERCRRFLADELGAYPSPATEAVYLEIIRSEPADVAAEPGAESPVPPRARRPKLAMVLALTVLAAGAVTAAFVFPRGGEAASPRILPYSLVRIDPETLKPTEVVPIKPRADFVLAAGGYVWITHGLLRHAGDTGLRDAGDRRLTRVDPRTKTADVVGGLAPCGLAPDPSGDVWVANCYALGPGANVVRVDARTLDFRTTIPVPSGAGIVRGLAYGGGSLWVGDANDAAYTITEVDPATQRRHPLFFDVHPKWLTWADGYGDLWLGDFVQGSVSRMDAKTGELTTYEDVALNSGYVVVQDDSVWVADWSSPRVARVPAVGAEKPDTVVLPVTTARRVGVTTLAVGGGAIWATVPGDHAVFRIDQKTHEATRVGLPYFPWGVAATEDGIWVSLRAHDA